MQSKDIVSFLSRSEAELYIFADYEMRHPFINDLFSKAFLTRKVFVGIPKQGQPFVIAHSIDEPFLTPFKEFKVHVYHTWQEMDELVENCLYGYKKVMMDVSDKGLLMRVALADYGTVDFIKSLGKEILSSKDLLSMGAILDGGNILSMNKAMELNLKVRDETIAFLRDVFSRLDSISEYEVQQFILSRYKAYHMVSDEPPIVAIASNANNPHYTPSQEVNSIITKGDLLLVDMWARPDEEKGIYSDITWMSYVGTKVPEIYAKAFQTLRKAVDAGVNFLNENLPNRKVQGFEVDQVVRRVVEKDGYGQWFTHRTGHSIYGGNSCHGPGTNIDDYESHDDRYIYPNTLFSHEPGIYTPEWGMRLETDVFTDGKTATEVGGHQQEIFALLS